MNIPSGTCALGKKGCFTDGKCYYNRNCENKVVTNADRIRAMSDEALAELLLDGCRGSTCSDQSHNDYGSVDCFKCRMDWLKQPAKDGDNDG